MVMVPQHLEFSFEIERSRKSIEKQRKNDQKKSHANVRTFLIDAIVKIFYDTENGCAM